MSVPGMSTAFWMADDKDLPGWIRDSRTAVKETGKALVAWDEWGKNPARAAGAVTFNVLTTVFTGGAGTAAKAGTVAKVISVAGKAGRLIDPMTYIGKAGSLAKVKIGDLFANLGKADGAFPKLDDVVWKDLPKADAPGITFPHPDDTVRLPDDALGRPQYFDKTSNQLLDHNGVPKQDLTSVPKGPDHPLAEVPKHEPIPATVGAHTADATAHTPGHTPGGIAEHTPGGVADHGAHNAHTEPGGGGTTHHGGTDTTHTGASHDTPTTGGGGHDGPTIPRQGGSGLPDDLGHGPGHGGPDPVTPSHGERPELPPHRDNAHDYTTAERKQIMEYQVHRANDPTDGYRKQHYNKLGHRLKVVPDHTGLVPPQLVEVSPGKWIPKSQLPPPVPPNYLDEARTVTHDHPTVTAEMTEKLDKAAKERWDAMQADKRPHTDYADAKAAHKAAGTDETLAAMEQARAHHKPFHEALSKRSEAFGEAIAREHAIPKEFPGAKEEPVFGPANGNDQFDQVYKHGDRYVVVEAKGNVGTDLGERRVAGDRVSQGTRAYFEDILAQMEKRGGTNPAEKALFDKLDAALKAGKVDYVVVKGADNSGTYTGHTIQRFDISN
ncbi:hypothetical protein ABT143_27745, partial [Streptomyces sp. NPDC002033]